MPLLTTKALDAHRRILIEYLKAKLEAEDWHGVADAAMDLRELDAMLLVHTGLHKGRLHG